MAEKKNVLIEESNIVEFSYYPYNLHCRPPGTEVIFCKRLKKNPVQLVENLNLIFLISVYFLVFSYF